MNTHRKRALVTGGAGLIGSHIVDLLVSEGWTVRILDNLEPQTHKNGKPDWINPAAEFRQGNVQDYETMHAALTDIDVVFHEAAYGGYMPEMSKYVLVNSFGTAQMLEIIRDHQLPIRKVLVASSQAVYSEGAANCPEHGHVVPLLRPAEQLRAGDFRVHCPVCGKPTSSIPTPEATPGGGETVYAPDQGGPGASGAAVGQTDRHSGRRVTILMHLRSAPVALQSLHRRHCHFLHSPIEWATANPIRGWCPDTRLLFRRRHRPRQSASGDNRHAGRLTSANVGSGRATSVRDLAEIIASQLGVKLAPIARGEFRPGEIRSLISDISRIRAIGYAPQTSIEQGIGRYVDWIKTQGTVEDYFSKAEAGLRAKGIVQSVKT